MKNLLKKNKVAYSPEAIQKKVIEDIQRPIKTLEDLESFLTKWWCRHYNRPYKCAEIKEYTLEELMYEYFDVIYRSNPEALQAYLEDESGASSEDENWLKEMMGEGYLSKQEQEEKLQPHKKNIDSVTKNKQEDDEFSFKFDRFI